MRRRGTSPVRVKLLLLLPLTLGMLVAATGFFAQQMASRLYLSYGLSGPELSTAQTALTLEIIVIGCVTAALGLAIAVGVTQPLKQVADRLGAMASGDLPGTIEVRSTSEVDSVAEAFNEAVRNRLVAVGTLTAGVAHELRNPLASLQGLTELLGRDFPPDDPRRAYVATMQQSIGRLNRLVENLLLLSSPGAPSAQAIDLRRVVREAMEFVRLGLNDGLATLTFVDSPQPCIVLINETRLSQALTNIVLNAVQATPAGGRVTVAVEVSGGQAIVRVHNTGSFIPPDRIKKLFAPFYTTRASGTGLGLAIAQQIVEAMGGRIRVESDAERGTTFTIELPLAAAGAQPASAAEVA